MKGWPEVGDDTSKPNDPACPPNPDHGRVDIDAGVSASPQGQNGTPLITWKTRRKMAWVALVAIILATMVYTGIIAFMSDAPADKRIDKLVDIYFYFTGFLSSMILGYFGFTMLPFLGGRRNG